MEGFAGLMWRASQKVQEVEWPLVPIEERRKLDTPRHIWHVAHSASSSHTAGNRRVASSTNGLMPKLERCIESHTCQMKIDAWLNLHPHLPHPLHPHPLTLTTSTLMCGNESTPYLCPTSSAFDPTAVCCSTSSGSHRIPPRSNRARYA